MLKAFFSSPTIPRHNTVTLNPAFFTPSPHRDDKGVQYRHTSPKQGNIMIVVCVSVIHIFLQSQLECYQREITCSCALFMQNILSLFILEPLGLHSEHSAWSQQDWMLFGLSIFCHFHFTLNWNGFLHHSVIWFLLNWMSWVDVGLV